MITKYGINLHLEFSTDSTRDSVYNKIKNALVNAKIIDTWTYGVLSKEESVRPDNIQEVV